MKIFFFITGAPPDGKILFKKPQKSNSDTLEIRTGRKKDKPKETDSIEFKLAKKVQKVKNKSLLSFDEDEDIE